MPIVKYGPPPDVSTLPPAPKYGMPLGFTATPFPIIKYGVPTTVDAAVVSPEAIIAVLGAAILFLLCIWVGLRWFLGSPGDKK
jgi:hypothetical protein